jgi:hypothetical protein
MALRLHNLQKPWEGGCFMKKTFSAVLFVGIFTMTFIGHSTPSVAGVDINIGVNFPPPPPVVIPEPPSVVVIPGTYVYFAPTIGADILFYHGYWYRPHEGRWYRANRYNGPWVHIDRKRVPVAIHHLPPNYRHIPPGHQRIPYRELNANWKTWEKEKHWDRNEDRHEGRGGYGEERHENDYGNGRGKGRH